MFSDIVDSTEVTSDAGPGAAERIRRRHLATIRRALVAGRGREVKSLGDGIMAVFTSSVEAVGSAIELRRSVTRDRECGGIALRIGLSTGDVDVDEEDDFGLPVVEAARLCALARPNQVLATDKVVLLAGKRGGYGYRSVGPVSLEGVDAPVLVSEVLDESLSAHGPKRSFVGRVRQLAALHDAFGVALSGRTGVVLVTGEPGIGKTTLVEEFLENLHSSEVNVCWGRCWEGPDAPPFWPWAQVLEQCASSVGASVFRDVADGELPALLSIAPTLSRRVPVSSSTTDGQSRLRQSDALSAFLETISASTPLVVVLDDIQWADPASLALLRYVVLDTRDHHLLLVVTYRDTENEGAVLDETVSALVRSRHCVRLQIDPLQEDEASAYIADVLGELPDRDMVSALLERTNGNTFFLTEIVRVFAERPDDDTVLRALPASVVDAIRRRLAALTSDARAVLDVASVLGQEFDLETLECVERLRGVAVVEQLDDLERAGLVVPAARLGTWQFAHGLVRDAVHDTLTAARRTVLHTEIARALEALDVDSRQSLESLTYHWSRAGTRDGARRAASYAVKAANTARRVFAHEDAVRHYLQAVELVEGRVSAREVGELVVAAADECFLAGDDKQGRELVRRATAIAGAENDIELLARAAITASRPGGRVVPDQEVIGLLEAALPRTELGTSLGTQVAARLALELQYRDRERADHLSRDALAAARRIGDIDTLVVALIARRYAVMRVDLLDEQLGVGEEILELASRANRRELSIQGHYARTAAFQQLGEYDAADAQMAALDQVATETRRPVDLAFSRLYRAMRAEMRGHYGEARRLLDEAQDIGRRLADIQLLTAAVALDASLCRDERRFDEAIGIANAIGELEGVGPVVRAFGLGLRASLGRDVSRSELTRCVAELEQHPRNWLWIGGVAEASVAAYYLSDGAAAHELLERLRPYADRNLVVTVNPQCALGPAQFFAAVAAACIGDVDDAVARLAAAVEQSERLQAAPWALRGAGLLARLLRARSPSDAARADAVEARGRELLTQLPECFATDEFHRFVGEGRRRDVIATAGLSERELTVLRLCATGASNDSIAAELHLSVKTIERHLSNCYRKLGVRNRAEATARIVRDGLE